jgi:NADH-quinone oxidoreductase subunit L
MEVKWLINTFILVPIAGFVLSVLIPRKYENLLSRVAFLTAGLNLFGFIVFMIYRASLKLPAVNLEEVTLYHSENYSFVVDFYFDKIGALFLFIGSLLTFLITVYSRYYLHRESGYKRFFNTILFFYVGYNFTILSGNFETLFIGWEILGMSSFLLIAFYRDRYIPVRNAVKVFSIYRIGDVGIIMAMWASHHLWHENITFIKLNNDILVHDHLTGHSATGIFISVMILITAMAKSAQLPFSSWLPRAMEGPTPSSAIFYGSLSVHLGVFLLLRTHPFWEHQTLMRILTAMVGLTTAIITFFIARVQSNIKSKIAYSSITQIGLIFIEISLGFDDLALVHFTGNAFLRTYQLLVSPSLVSYLIRDQFYHFKPHKRSLEDSMPRRIEYTFYLLSLREWNLDRFMNRRIFRPFKKMGHRLDFLRVRNVFLFFIPLYMVGIVFLSVRDFIPPFIVHLIPALCSFIGLLMVLKSFSERHFPRLAWLLVILNHFWIALAVSFNEHFDSSHILLYLSGVVICGISGYICLELLVRREPTTTDLNKYYGHVYEYPVLAFMFLISCLGLMGFPVTMTFIGEDLIFSHIHEDQHLLAFFNALSFILGGIALIRIYSRLFLGPHCKTYHETALRSS